jgi:hypothetical protein
MRLGLEKVISPNAASKIEESRREAKTPFSRSAQELRAMLFGSLLADAVV